MSARNRVPEHIYERTIRNYETCIDQLDRKMDTMRMWSRFGLRDNGCMETMRLKRDKLIHARKKYKRENMKVTLDEPKNH